MAIGELLELQTEIWYDFILITTEDRDDPIYKFSVTDRIPVAVLNKPVRNMDVISKNEWLNCREILYLVIYIQRGVIE